jgi:cell division transport system permease protein
MLSLVRIIKFAFQDIGRNIGLSAMTVLILILMLLSTNLLWAVKTLTNESVSLVKEQVNMNLYVKPDVSDKDFTDLKGYIETLPEVDSVKTVSKKEVLEAFEKRHRLSPEVLGALKELGGNPFGPTIIVRTKEPGNYTEVISALGSSDYNQFVESKSFEGHEDALTRLQSITNRVENVGLGLTIVFGFIAFLIIFNTIRVAIFTHKVEISIKRLVGAQNWFIRGPYIVEAVVFTTISIVITGLLMYFIFQWIDPYLGVVFPNSFSLTNYYKSNILYLSLVQTLAVLALTILSSGVAMRKHLKV